MSSPAPKFPGYRLMQYGETIQEGDCVKPKGKSELQASIAIDCLIEPDDVGYYYRPTPATPAPESPAPAHAAVVAQAVDRAIAAGLGASEWEAFMPHKAPAQGSDIGTGSETSPDAARLREALAEHLYMATGRVVPWARCERQSYWRDRADRVLALLGSAALSAGLAWTKEKPKVDGRYWYRVPGETKQSIDLVRVFTGAPCWNSTERHAWVPVSGDLEWAGPIPETSATQPVSKAEAEQSSPSLVWTKDKPTANGWYWLTTSPDKDPEIVRVHDGHFYDEDEKYSRWGGHCKVVDTFESCEWAGPIPAVSPNGNGGMA